MVFIFVRLVKWVNSNFVLYDFYAPDYPGLTCVNLCYPVLTWVNSNSPLHELMRLIKWVNSMAALYEN
jgi:hypothetical protein